MGVLKAKVNGVWEDISGVTTHEVAVSATDPRAGAMKNAILWLDTSTASPTLRYWDATKRAAWLPIDYLSLDGTQAMNTGAEIRFPNATGPKIFLYAETFGLGVESGETSIFASSKIGFRQNASNGTLWGYIDATGMYVGGQKVLTNAQQRSNSGFLSLPARNLTGSYASIYNTPISYPSGNRRIKVTVQLKVNPGGESHIYVKCFGQETSWTKHAVMADTIGPAVFVNNGATGTSSAVNVEVKADIGSGNILGDGSSWVLVEDLGPR